jgi:uncharacterized membrane protein
MSEPDDDEESRVVERTIMLTDAVVAIAMTLLILPLAELAPEVDVHDVGGFVQEHSSAFLSFGLSFLVIYVFWAAHERAFRTVRELGPAMRFLNLFVVAFLPFPTALVGREATTSTAPVYIGTMFVLSVLTSGMTHLGLAAGRTRRRLLLAWTTSGVFAVCTLLSLVNGGLGLFSLLLLLVVRLAELAPTRRRARPAQPGSAS